MLLFVYIYILLLIIVTFIQLLIHGKLHTESKPNGCQEAFGGAESVRKANETDLGRTGFHSLVSA